MIPAVLLTLATAFVAFSNGANDNFKGVATLFGGGLATYRRALTWATLTTFCGSVASVFLAQGLLHKFSGMGLVPAGLFDSAAFAPAVALGAATTVIAATRLGFPVSTTHALLGALGGVGIAAAGPGALEFNALGHGFLLPLLLSPVLALGLGGAIYLSFRGVRGLASSPKDICICVEPGGGPGPMLAGAVGASVSPSRPVVTAAALPAADCAEGRFGVLALDSRKVADGLHWLSAGAVSFARGLNDTPKIAALLLGVHVFAPGSGSALVAIGIGVGGLLAARRVAETMSLRITALAPLEALASNLSTAALVLGATHFALPVSTTHVAVGSLFGIGLATGQANMRMIRGIVLSWVLTLPCAAAAGGLAFGAARAAGL